MVFININGTILKVMKLLLIVFVSFVLLIGTELGENLTILTENIDLGNRRLVFNRVLMSPLY